MQDEKNGKRANLRDVARAAGVSVATASRVLNTPERVSADTRARVEAKIAELQFLPSAPARAFSTGRTRVVGVLVSTLDNAIFARVLDSLENRLGQADLSLVVATTEDSPAAELQKARDLLSIGAEALIVTGVTRDPGFAALADRAKVPVIAISYFDTAYAYPTIGYDNAAAARLALDHLYDLGHRRIAVLHGPASASDRTRSRLGAIEAGRRDARVTLFETDISVAGGGAVVGRVLGSKATFDACLCTSDVIATGALYELARRGVAVPGTMSVVGIDDLPTSQETVPRLTSVRLPVRDMGAAAAEAAIAWLATGHAPAPRLLPVKLILRESVGPPPKPLPTTPPKG